jgi:hypothetical protein
VPDNPDAKKSLRKGKLLAALVAPAGALVAVVLLVLRLHLQPLSVPRYTFVADGDVASARDVRPGARFELEAVPAIEVQGAVTARAFLVPGAGKGDVMSWQVPMEIGRDGSVHVAGNVDALFAGVPPGDWVIAIVIGRPETLPADPHQLLAGGAEDAGSAAWRVVRKRVRLGQ